MIGTAKISSWLPEAASAQAQQIDGPFYAVYVLGAVAVILVAGLALAFAFQFRRTDENAQGAPGGRANPLYQGLFVVAGLALAIYAFTAGFGGFLDQTQAPYGAYAVNVTARDGGYDFTYPNGHLADTLHVATGQPVQLTMTSEDVIHSLQIPAMRVNQAILPGRTTQAWFTATAADTFELRSAVAGLADMRSALVAHAPADFEAWMLAATDIFAGRTMAEAGEFLYNSKGCKACHTLDGTKLVGPSFKNVYGYEFDTRDGTRVLADEAYIRESILNPNASVIAGYEPVMTPYEGNITDKEIEAITIWLRTLSDRGGNIEEAAADAPAEGQPTGEQPAEDPAAGGQQEETR